MKIDAARSGAGEDANISESHPLRVLVAEGNPVNQVVARLILMKLSYSADLVANGLEAVVKAGAGWERGDAVMGL